MESKRKKKIPIPEDMKRLIIGRHRSGLEHISKDTNANLFLKSNEIYVEGTDEQIGLAEKLIHERLEKLKEHEEVIEVPIQFVGSIIGKEGRIIKDIRTLSGARITILNKEKIAVVKITGSPSCCKEARRQINSVVDKKKENGCEVKVNVPEEYVGSTIGKKGKTLKMLETKSGTKIRFNKENRIFTISGSPAQCERASALITQKIIGFKEQVSRKKLGGGDHFVCFNQNYERAVFLLINDNNTPKLNAHINGYRHKIEVETQTNVQKEFNEATVLSIKEILLASLRHLHQKKDEEQLKIDLWCHFGKVYVHNVDEAEEERRFSMSDIDARLAHINNKLCEKVEPNGEVEDGSGNGLQWKTTFEQGIDPSTINHKMLEDGNLMEHVHTQWRYDYAFTTPSKRCVRLKLWEKLRHKEPPSEVKNLLKKVSLEHQGEDLVAWLCYPSKTIVTGEIMTPSSKYDCRLKLRTGKRFALEETNTAEEEDKTLSDYLSKCTLDSTNHCLNLPSPFLPEGFKCSFYRAAEERIFSTQSEENESFTVIVLDEKRWDSDSSEKREKKQLGIRVVLDSWSDALLSGHWEPEEIVSKLPNFMEFFQDFRGMLFD